jgi:glycosyltransferase involved in cell wall biosynthesis
MRIAQVAPLIESVPPRLYGGSERVVSALTEELVRRGHDVFLFASGDSFTSGTLVSSRERSLRLDGEGGDAVSATIVELSQVFDRAADFDVIHSHVDFLAFPFARYSLVPVMSTAHGRLDLPETQMIYNYFSDVGLVAISDDQRRSLPNANWLGRVYNGVNFEMYELKREEGKYLSFLGRICPEKRVDRAIEVARALDMPLKIAAKIDRVDQEYFDHAVRPFLNSSLVEFVGEVAEAQKSEFLGNSLAYLFPIDWPEPFGLTMVEAMACGTPVIAMKSGSVPEVVLHGTSGFVCPTFREFLDCVNEASSLNRARIREYAESRFSAQAMASGYEALYAKVTGCLEEMAVDTSVQLWPDSSTWPSEVNSRFLQVGE